MNVDKIFQNNIRVKPTKKKMQQAKTLISKTSGLPKEMPIEREVRFVSPSEMLDRVKNSIQISIDNMKK